ncbi:MAG: WecB/TagA/CpsF family glycosyltransferase [Patescibacteria group bacterium]|jgi:N-acetylglucosaminyldiphosphoundecaprenol N-acetyl-beta-D-mannosaminyltransferase
MLKTNILSIPLTLLTKEDILEQIKKGKRENGDFLHIISVNPENLVIARKDDSFRNVVVTTQSHIPDGMGVVAAVRILTGKHISRLTGVDLMKTLLEASAEYSLRVLLIGGKANLAEYVSKCYNSRFPSLNIAGIQGISNIAKPTGSEEKAIFRIVSTTRPHLVFVSFGSPQQELWIDKHKHEFGGAMVMGVGGAFDFLGNRITRAPNIIQNTGLEWLYRLLREPWRIVRQTRLIVFLTLVIKERINKWLSF